MSREQFVKITLFSVLFVFFSDVRNAHTDKLIVSYAGVGGAYFPLSVAAEAGLFRKYGFDVDLVFVVGSLGLNTLVSGRTPIVAISPLIIALWAARGGNAIMIATMTNTLPYILVARQCRRRYGHGSSSGD